MTVVRASTATPTNCAARTVRRHSRRNGPNSGGSITAARDAVSGGGASTSFETPWKSQQSRFRCTLYHIVDQMGFSFIFKNKQISFYFLINNCSYNTNIYDVYNTDII